MNYQIHPQFGLQLTKQGVRIINHFAQMACDKSLNANDVSTQGLYLNQTINAILSKQDIDELHLVSESVAFNDPRILMIRTAFFTMVTCFEFTKK